MQICIIQMGGTIDKVYPQLPNAYGFEINTPQSVEVLNRWNVLGQFHFHTIAQKDSQDLTKKDLGELVDFINATSYDAYMITHGTDTMELTANFVKEKLSKFTKTIVLTGSRLPACVIDSDAALNLGMSIGVINSKSAGVYIVLDGTVQEVEL